MERELMLIKVHADPKHHAEVPAWWFVVVVYACMHLLCYVSVLFCCEISTILALKMSTNHFN